MSFRDLFAYMYTETSPARKGDGCWLEMLDVPILDMARATLPNINKLHPAPIVLDALEARLAEMLRKESYESFLHVLEVWRERISDAIAGHPGAPESLKVGFRQDPGTGIIHIYFSTAASL